MVNKLTILDTIRYTYWNCTYLVMITMMLKAMLMVLGWYSVWTESRMLALLCAVLHPLMFILHLTGTIFICMYGVEESSALTDELMDVFLALVYKWDTDPRASRILKQIMEYVRSMRSLSMASSITSLSYRLGVVVLTEGVTS